MLRIIETIALIIFSSATIGFNFFLLSCGRWLELVLCAVSIPLAYFFADLFSGIVHWLCDSLGSSTTPLWGPMLVKPFRDHHHDPQRITRISLAENLGSSAIAGSFIFWLTIPSLTWSPPVDGLRFFLCWFWSWFLVFGVLSNLFHRWAHFQDGEKPNWMRTLQKMHLILNSHVHLVHHKKPHRTNYCILSGWANAMTNRMPWNKIENILLLFGIPTCFD